MNQETKNSKSIDPKLSETEIAYLILKYASQGKNLRELMQEVFIIKGCLADSQMMAAVHTEMTLDSRFNLLGQGSWGLKEWTQKKIVKRNASRAGMHKISFGRR